jgi:hypothetical protein
MSAPGITVKRVRRRNREAVEGADVAGPQVTASTDITDKGINTTEKDLKSEAPEFETREEYTGGVVKIEKATRDHTELPSHQGEETFIEQEEEEQQEEKQEEQDGHSKAGTSANIAGAEPSEPADS